MKDEKDSNPGHITIALCNAQREVLRNELKGQKADMKEMKDRIKSVDSRTWQILAGIGLSILLTILSMTMK